MGRGFWLIAIQQVTAYVLILDLLSLEVQEGSTIIDIITKINLVVSQDWYG